MFIKIKQEFLEKEWNSDYLFPCHLLILGQMDWQISRFMYLDDEANTNDAWLYACMRLKYDANAKNELNTTAYISVKKFFL